MSSSELLLLACLIGVVAGLRSLLAPAAVGVSLPPAREMQRFGGRQNRQLRHGSRNRGPSPLYARASTFEPLVVDQGCYRNCGLATLQTSASR